MGTDKRKFLFHKSGIFFTTEQNKTSISLDWRKLLLVIYLLRNKRLLNIFQKMAELSFFLCSLKPHYYTMALTYLHSWLHFCFDFHLYPKKKKGRCTCIILSTCLVVQARSILCVMAEHWAWRAGSFIPDSGT